MWRFWLLVLALAAGSLSGPVALLGGCSQGDSVEKGCQTNEDCPRPDRQICEIATGVCVGFTSLPGRVDGGDDEEVDASQGSDGGSP